MTDVTYMVTGSMFLADAVMWWLGWILLPTKIGAFFVASDFAAVDRRFQIWIWLFRMHLFGHLVSMTALASFATLGIGNAQRASSSGRGQRLPVPGSSWRVSLLMSYHTGPSDVVWFWKISYDLTRPFDSCTYFSPLSIAWMI